LRRDVKNDPVEAGLGRVVSEGVDVNIIIWLLLGLVAGALAKALMPGDDPGGIFITILLGIVGAFVGGFIWNLATGEGGVSGFNIGSVLIATLGAIVLLALYRLVARNRSFNT
jgi:uncharacterized membrane protein YeaQ/YmgE (transglycosylase-associated protein family)